MIKKPDILYCIDFRGVLPCPVMFYDKIHFQIQMSDVVIQQSTWLAMRRN